MLLRRRHADVLEDRARGGGRHQCHLQVIGFVRRAAELLLRDGHSARRELLVPRSTRKKMRQVFALDRPALLLDRVVETFGAAAENGQVTVSFHQEHEAIPNFRQFRRGEKGHRGGHPETEEQVHIPARAGAARHPDLLRHPSRVGLFEDLIKQSLHSYFGEALRQAEKSRGLRYEEIRDGRRLWFKHFAALIG
ncbi:MAG TPA: hypothetical protein VEK57_12740 [Thermoanaerobaculia bacterium]|nr:hypothetical protein [Thermoanaerobaculia bacterium]